MVMGYIARHRLINLIYDSNIKGSSTINRLIIEHFTPKPKHSLIIKTIYGFRLKIDPAKDNGVENSIYIKGTYEKGTLDIIGKILKKGDVFIDIGANIGLMSIFSSYKVGENGQVISFEPNPETRKILEENIVLNSINNIKIEPYALSNTKRESKIYDNFDVNRGASSLIKPSTVTQSYDVIEIPFSEYFGNDSKIDLIKIDVEGYELKVLEGAKEFLINCKNPPILIIEFSLLRENSFGNELFLLATFIKNINGYRLFKSMLGKERISKLVEIEDEKDLPRHDNVYCFTNQHLEKIDKRLF